MSWSKWQWDSNSSYDLTTADTSFTLNDTVNLCDFSGVHYWVQDLVFLSYREKRWVFIPHQKYFETETPPLTTIATYKIMIHLT